METTMAPACKHGIGNPEQCCAHCKGWRPLPENNQNEELGGHSDLEHVIGSMGYGMRLEAGRSLLQAGHRRGYYN